jgi:hypothetical protein
MVTERLAALTGNPGEGVDVGGIRVFVEVGVEVGQGVIVGSPVGEDVGKVGVGVKAARMSSFWSGYMSNLAFKPFKVRNSFRVMP